jgi:hypothetical protein
LAQFLKVNIRGSSGYKDGWQRHHLIPTQCAQDRRTRGFIAAMQQMGFRFDDFPRNGILLPTTYAQAASSGLPVHSGPHPRYNRTVIDLILALATRFNFGNDRWEAHRAFSHFRLLQARLRIRMAQELPVSIDNILLERLARGSVIIDRATTTLLDEFCWQSSAID